VKGLEGGWKVGVRAPASIGVPKGLLSREDDSELSGGPMVKVAFCLREDSASIEAGRDEPDECGLDLLPSASGLGNAVAVDPGRGGDVCGVIVAGSPVANFKA